MLELEALDAVERAILDNDSVKLKQLLMDKPSGFSNKALLLVIKCRAKAMETAYVDINVPDVDQANRAIEVKTKRLIKLILDNSTTANINSAFAYACTNSSLDIVRTMIDDHGADHKLQVELAFARRHEGLIDLFMERGLDVECCNRHHLLHLAIPISKDLVARLLQLGADVNAIDKGWSVLCCAISFGNLEVVRLLIENGASVEWNELKRALAMRKLDIARILLEQRAEVNRVSLGLAFGEFASISSESDLLEMSELLVEFGASVDSRVAGKSPIARAAARGFARVIELLFERGARSDWGAISAAFDNNHCQIVTLLMERNMAAVMQLVDF